MSSGHHIHAAGVEGMTLTQTFDAQPQAPQHAVPSDGFAGVTRAGRVKTALPPDPWTEHNLIKTDAAEHQALAQV